MAKSTKDKSESVDAFDDEDTFFPESSESQKDDELDESAFDDIMSNELEQFEQDMFDSDDPNDDISTDASIEDDLADFFDEQPLVNENVEPEVDNDEFESIDQSLAENEFKPYAEGKNQNLSSVLKSIKPDGPADLSAPSASKSSGTTINVDELDDNNADDDDDFNDPLDDEFTSIFNPNKTEKIEEPLELPEENVAIDPELNDFPTVMDGADHHVDADNDFSFDLEDMADENFDSDVAPEKTDNENVQSEPVEAKKIKADPLSFDALDEEDVSFTLDEDEDLMAAVKPLPKISASRKKSDQDIEVEELELPDANDVGDFVYDADANEKMDKVAEIDDIDESLSGEPSFDLDDGDGGLIAKPNKTNVINLALSITSLCLFSGLGFMVYQLSSQIDTVDTQLNQINPEAMATTLKQTQEMKEQLSTEMSELKTTVQTMNEEYNRQKEVQQNQINDQAIQQKKEMDTINTEMEKVDKKLDELLARMDQLEKAPVPVSKAKEFKPRSIIKPTKKMKPKKKVVPKKVEKKPTPASGKALWSVNVISLSSQEAAGKMQIKFKKLGIPVESKRTVVNGKDWYRLRVTGFETRKEAVKYADTVKQKLGTKSIWVTQK